jgi:hypothetical protein
MIRVWCHAFFIKQIAVQRAKLSACERELIGLVYAIRHSQPYLWGRPFVVRAYHFSLKYLLDQKSATIPRHQWASKLLGFDFLVEYKPGLANTVADALSRRDTEALAELSALSIPSFQLFDSIQQEIMSSPELSELKKDIITGIHGDKWHMIDDLITMAGYVYIPPTSPCIAEVLTNTHKLVMKGFRKPFTAFVQISTCLTPDL